eukprot:868306-Rhodomonas_salina.1
MGPVGVPTGALARIGYISADFGDHPTTDLALATILRQHEHMQVFCYVLNESDGSELWTRLRTALGDRFRTMSSQATDGEWADLIREDGIQTLIHLNGHTAGA